MKAVAVSPGQPNSAHLREIPTPKGGYPRRQGSAGKGVESRPGRGGSGDKRRAGCASDGAGVHMLPYCPPAAEVGGTMLGPGESVSGW